VREGLLGLVADGVVADDAGGGVVVLAGLHGTGPGVEGLLSSIEPLEEVAEAAPGFRVVGMLFGVAAQKLDTVIGTTNDRAVPYLANRAQDARVPAIGEQQQSAALVLRYLVAVGVAAHAADRAIDDHAIPIARLLAPGCDLLRRRDPDLRDRMASERAARCAAGLQHQANVVGRGGDDLGAMVTFMVDLNG